MMEHIHIPDPSIKGWAVRVNGALWLKFYNTRDGAAETARNFFKDPTTRSVEIVPMSAWPATE